MAKKEVKEKKMTEALKDLSENEIKLDEFNDLLKQKEPPGVIDFRGDREDLDHKIESAYHMTMENLVEENLNKILPDKSKIIVLVCAQSFAPTRMIALTSYAYPTLKVMGYKNVKVLRDWGWGRD